jgi:hypothetical protein
VLVLAVAPPLFLQHSQAQPCSFLNFSLAFTTYSMFKLLLLLRLLL